MQFRTRANSLIKSSSSYQNSPTQHLNNLFVVQSFVSQLRFENEKKNRFDIID